MKQLLVAWLALIAVTFALAGSCAIDHRSGAFECTKQSDCTPPRVCSENLCVLTGGSTDAMPDSKTDGSVDARLCPEQCTSCNPTTKECVIDCGAGANCTNQVICPSTWNCNIKCDIQNSCRNGVNCLNSASCTISCKGQGACRNLSCGAGECDVDCSGNGSCSTVNCASSCACDVICSAAAACQGLVCPDSCGVVRGCTSTLRPMCDDCP